MTNLVNFYLSPLIKVKAKKYQVSNDGTVECESRKFRVNAHKTTYDALRIILARYFNICGEFTISYKNNNNNFVELSSDQDLQLAFSKAYYSSHLYVLVTSQPLEDEIYEDWAIISPAEIPDEELNRSFEKKTSLVESFFSKVGKTMGRFSRALSFESSPEGDCDKMPMTLEEYQQYFDQDGRLVREHEFHLAVYRGGLEQSLRPDAWMHLLNVFPEEMTTLEKERYLELKASEYCKLRSGWQRLMNEGEASETLKDISNLVMKDVKRTDRNQRFYSGSDDNKNIQCLFNILITYASTHPSVHYCQGMSDMLSPIFYVMKDESRAYIAFCGLMERLERNFRSDGRSIQTKFKHLRRMLYFYDRELFLYLRDQGASSLLYCYRWLVLELKREFPYKDALHMLEVTWGSLPPKPPAKELRLCRYEFNSSGVLTNSTNVHPRKDSLIWVNDYYSVSSSTRTEPRSKSMKTDECRNGDSKAKEISWKCESMTEGEVKLPIHYRKRRYRSYISRKLDHLSLPSKARDIVRPKKSSSDRLGICQSWAYGDESENHSLKLNTAVVTAREFLRGQWCYSNTVNEIQLNNWLNGKWWDSTEKFDDLQSVVETLRQRHGSSDSNYSTNSANSELLLSDSENHEPNTTKISGRSRSEGYESDTAYSSKEYSTDDCSEPDDEDDPDDFYSSCKLIDSFVGKKYEEAATYFRRKKEQLPPPHALGDGNPFLLFLCTAMMVEHRDVILQKQMDLNELCIYFDKLVRKHKLSKVINKARTMFGEYLNMGWNEDLSDSDEDEFMN